MPLKWVPIKGIDDGRDGLVPVAEMVAMDMLAESGLLNGMVTGWGLYCNRHWDTGAPDEWIVRCTPTGTDSFPTKAEAMAYAEVTYTLGEANATQ